MPKNEKKGKNADLNRLRSAAEQLLLSREVSADAREKGIDEIFQELQVYQVELELQNDELRIANEDLEWQRLRFANIYNLAPIGYFILNEAGLILEVNAAVSQLLATRRGNIAGKLFRWFVAGESADAFHIFFRMLLSSGEKNSCNLKMTAKDGTLFYAQLEGIYVKQTEQCYLAVLDISESIRISENLAKSNEQLQLAMDASIAGTWELRPQTMTLKFDESGQRIAGTSLDDNFNAFLDLIHPDDRFMVDQQFRTAFNSAKEIDLVCRLISPENEQRFAGLRGHVLRRADGEEVLIGIIMDVTEKRRLEIAAEELQKQREKEVNAVAVSQAEENERRRLSEALHDSVGQLLYGVKLQLSQLNEQAPSGGTKQIHELLDRAIRETRNLSFELSPAMLVDFGLRDTLDELAQRLSLPNFNISCNVKGLSGRLDIMLETHIFRIVQELINNCMKHAKATAVQVNINKNKKITIEVIDNGQGFQVTDLENRPKGAGLSSIRNRISVYNGCLHVDSESGKGTRIKVELNL